MKTIFEKSWDVFLGPLLQRPKHLQVAALCHRGAGDDRQYLLVTSRDTGRWIIPKGWPIPGLKSSEAALQEAWEEAGVRKGDVSSQPIGTYTYNKRRATGLPIPVETLVYDVEVKDLASNYPEEHERTRKWVTADAAATMVEERELQSLFIDQSRVAA